MLHFEAISQWISELVPLSPSLILDHFFSVCKKEPQYCTVFQPHSSGPRVEHFHCFLLYLLSCPKFEWQLSDRGEVIPNLRNQADFPGFPFAYGPHFIHPRFIFKASRMFQSLLWIPCPFNGQEIVVLWVKYGLEQFVRILLHGTEFRQEEIHQFQFIMPSRSFLRPLNWRCQSIEKLYIVEFLHLIP